MHMKTSNELRIFPTAMDDKSEHSGLSLSLSLSLPCSQLSKPTMEMRKKKSSARRSELSCALILSTPSYIYNPARPSQSPLLAPPMVEKMAESSDGGNTTLSLQLSLSLPSTTPEFETCTSEQVKDSSDSTLISCTGTRRASESAPAGDGVEGSNDVPPPAREGPNRVELQPARRGTWQETARRLGSTDPLLIQEKRLFATDVSRGHGRFLFTEPEEDKGKAKEKGKQPHIRAPRKLLDMLTPTEKAAVGAGGGLPVLLLDRWGQEYPGNKLRHWTSSNSYVIVGKWTEFVRLNEIEADDVVEVYVFRVPPERAAPTPTPSSASHAAAPEAQAAAELAVAPRCPLQDRGGGEQEEWRLAVVVCSRVPLEEEERRRRKWPEIKKERHQQEEASTRIQRKKRKCPGGGCQG